MFQEIKGPVDRIYDMKLRLVSFYSYGRRYSFFIMMPKDAPVRLPMSLVNQYVHPGTCFGVG